jgi:hypothetical protein
MRLVRLFEGRTRSFIPMILKPWVHQNIVSVVSLRRAIVPCKVVFRFVYGTLHDFNELLSSSDYLSIRDQILGSPSIPTLRYPWDVLTAFVYYSALVSFRGLTMFSLTSQENAALIVTIATKIKCTIDRRCSLNEHPQTTKFCTYVCLLVPFNSIMPSFDPQAPSSIFVDYVKWYEEV